MTNEEFLISMRNTAPLSSSAQIEDFEKTTVYQDLVREWELWIDDMRTLFEEGKSSESADFYRGAIKILKQVTKTTVHLKELNNQMEE